MFCQVMSEHFYKMDSSHLTYMKEHKIMITQRTKGNMYMSNEVFDVPFVYLQMKGLVSSHFWLYQSPSSPDSNTQLASVILTLGCSLPQVLYRSGHPSDHWNSWLSCNEWELLQVRSVFIFHLLGSSLIKHSCLSSLFPKKFNKQPLFNIKIIFQIYSYFLPSLNDRILYLHAVQSNPWVCEAALCGCDPSETIFSDAQNGGQVSPILHTSWLSILPWPSY